MSNTNFGVGQSSNKLSNFGVGHFLLHGTDNLFLLGFSICNLLSEENNKDGKNKPAHNRKKLFFINFLYF
jgi:hypothetical protein